MPTTDGERISIATRAIYKALNTYAFGRNEVALNEINPELTAIVDASHRIPGGGYIREKATSLQFEIEILFSPRKALRYGGTDTVKLSAISNLSKIESWIEKA